MQEIIIINIETQNNNIKFFVKQGLMLYIYIKTSKMIMDKKNVLIYAWLSSNITHLNAWGVLSIIKIIFILIYIK